MQRPIKTLLALVAVSAGVIAMAPDAAQRDNPTPTGEFASSSPGILVVDMIDDPTEAQLEVLEGVLGADLDWVHELSVDEGLAQGWVPDLASAVASLEDHALVEVVEPELTLSAYEMPNDPLYEKQWHLREMGAPVGWSTSPQGRGVIVAVIDTGVARVADLGQTKVLPGKSFIPGFPSSHDDNGHGTHVAGTIAQSTNNGIGVAGVAPQATILPVKVLTKWGSGTSGWIAAGIDYAADEGADVINLSLGGGYSRVIHNAIKKARAKGVVVVAAAGNSGRKGVGYPGALSETIGVSAVGPGGAPAPYTSWGKGVDIAAPGGDKTKPGGGVWQHTVRGGEEVYAEFQGTSMAAPHVAGAAAVLMSTGTCNADCVERVLLDSAKGTDWDPKLGHGRLDLGAAMAQMGGGGSDSRGRFGLGILLALLVASLSGARTDFKMKAAAVSAVTAGGLFFLGWLPIGNSLTVQLLSASLFSWPTILIGPGWAEFPLWLSAALPLLMGTVFGAQSWARPLALGFATGAAAYFLHGAASGDVVPTMLPATVGLAWMGLHGTVCLLIAMALAGLENLEREQGNR